MSLDFYKLSIENRCFMKREIILDNIDQDTFNHIIELWKCVRLNNSTIPDDLLDEFKIILLSHYNNVDNKSKSRYGSSY